ncbi:MAG: response regulator [Verrucomicrobiota bacterium]
MIPYRNLQPVTKALIPDLTLAANASATLPATSVPPSSPDADWVVVIVYDDTRAGRRAVLTLDAVVHKLGGKKRLHPRLWRFDLLEDPDWRAAATAEADHAGLLILSASCKGALPATVQRWVRGWLDQRRGSAAALAALLGPADDADALDSPRVQRLRNTVEAAGLSFFAPEPAPPNQVKLASHPLSVPSPRRILLVEDDEAIRKLNERVLVGAGYRVDAVPGSQPGWDALQTHAYDLLITDNQMPGMSGLELVRRLRAAQMGVPVILASGGLNAEALAENEWLQPATLLPKPYLGGGLLTTVAEVLALASQVAGSAARALPETIAESEHWSHLNHWGHWGLND